MLKERSSGIILHITSLPSKFGIGDLGPEAYKFADFLANAEVRYWQILPLSPVEGGSGYSPYSGLSAFAGNPMLISPEFLLREKYLKKSDITVEEPFPADYVDFQPVISFKKKLLDKAFSAFKNQDSKEHTKAYDDFCDQNHYWLEDFADFMAFKNHFENKMWLHWPEEFRDRKGKPMKKLRKELADAIEKEKFLQFIFFHQWDELKKYCAEKNIGFFGDIPFYVGHDSADVWSHPHLFKLHHDKSPKAVAGVPPDYFSATGQLWGMPVFDWDVLRDKNYSWWVHRIAHNLEMFDLIRLDHFRAFSDYWEVPADHDTAVHGTWQPGPGRDLFKTLKNKLRKLPIIAEDLGDIDQKVYDLMEAYGLPGMKVLHFAFDAEMPKSAYISHHHVPDSVVYTGTHDNNTSKGWYKQASAEEKKRIATYLNTNTTENNIADLMTRLALSSVAKLAVVPMQDVLGLGEEAIMNIPSTATDNWKWRMKPGKATTTLAKKIQKIVQLYYRGTGPNGKA